ncbi:TPA: DeoR family transcriptional regulator [Vibrio parahaemolyticus]|nr:DeoR family transcriptional regulator [Vibrio parahaemolyticus]
MKKEERINNIRIALIHQKVITVAKLAEIFCVTERTIRRDLQTLKKEGIAELFFGGAKLITKTKSFDKPSLINITKKFKVSNMNLDIRKESNTQEDHIGVYVLGSFNVDIVSEVESFPQHGQTIQAISTNFYAGGKGSNQATAASMVSDNVHLTVKIGKDSFNEKAKSHILGNRINSSTIFEDDIVPTGNALIFVSNTEKDNMITIDLGSNKNISREELISEIPKILKSKVFLTQLENNFDITKESLEIAKEHNVTVILNPAPYRSEVKEALRYVDILTPNETEASDLSGIQVVDIESAKEAAKIIQSMGSRVVIITMGSKGCLSFDGETFQFYPSYKAAVVDTSGAGDSFNGALAACLSNGETLNYSIKFASAFASLAVERKGASNMPEKHLALSRMESN